MSHLRARKSEHEWVKSKYQRVVEPTGDFDVEEISLVRSGACGAFVHGLEDEFDGKSVTLVDIPGRLVLSDDTCLQRSAKRLLIPSASLASIVYLWLSRPWTFWLICLTTIRTLYDSTQSIRFGSSVHTLPSARSTWRSCWAAWT